MAQEKEATGSGSGARVRLRGYERMLTMADDGSMKIVHAMALHASSPSALTALLTQLPQALVRTFNRHPRMRAMQLKGEFAMAKIQPQITLETMSKLKLLEIREIAGHEGQETESWEIFSEVQSNIPFDRYSKLPYFVRVWRYPDQNRIRMMLFSDHYMSDGVSGLVVLNDLLSFASELSHKDEAASEASESDTTRELLPLLPSLLELWLAPNKWRLRLSRWAVLLFGKLIFKNELKSFTPVIKPRSDQHDFSVPVKVNSSSALFALGTRDNMLMALSRCREERVTFFGALAAAIMVAYYVGSGQDSKKKPFKLVADVDFNMRHRVPCPPKYTPIGAYLATSPLEVLGKKGVDFDSTRFWDFARQCKRELEGTLASVFMPLTMLYLDENVHMEGEMPEDMAVPNSVTSDVNISSVGKYPYKTTHAVTTAASTIEDLRIESVHVYNSSPHLGSAAILYVMSTDKFSYSMMHKYESQDAERVFSAYIACVERVGEITSGQTMAQVAQAVAEACR